MKKEIVISPEELYFLGTVLQAKYIDYAYVAAMDDIGQNYAMFESETRASLVKAGILSEDFGGNIELDEEVRALLSPIFFGETETSIDVCVLGNPSYVTVFKFHFLDDAVTMVTGSEKKLIVKAIDRLTIQELVGALLPEEYACTESTQIPEINQEKVTRFVAVKSASAGGQSSVKTFIEMDGVFYCEDGDVIESMTRDMFVSNAYTIAKGE